VVVAVGDVVAEARDVERERVELHLTVGEAHRERVRPSSELSS
jgi:hypothetical protein